MTLGDGSIPGLDGHLSESYCHGVVMQMQTCREDPFLRERDIPEHMSHLAWRYMVGNGPVREDVVLVKCLWGKGVHDSPEGERVPESPEMAGYHHRERLIILAALDSSGHDVRVRYVFPQYGVMTELDEFRQRIHGSRVP